MFLLYKAKLEPSTLKCTAVLTTLAQHMEPSSKLEIPVFLLYKAKLEPSSEMKEKVVLATQALLKDPLPSSELKTPAFLSMKVT